MKRLLAFILAVAIPQAMVGQGFSAWPGQAGAPIQVGAGVTGSVTGSSATSTTVAITVANANDAIVVNASWCPQTSCSPGVGAAISSVCDNGTTCGAGHVFTAGASTYPASALYGSAVFVLPTTTSGSHTVTITFASNVGFIQLEASEWSGMNSSPVDATNSGNSTTGSPSVAVTSTQANELIYMACVSDNTLTAGSGYALINGAGTNRADESKVGVTATGYTAAMSQTSGNWSCAATTFI